MYKLSRISGQLLNHCTKKTIRMGSWVSRSPQIGNNGRAMHVTAGKMTMVKNGLLLVLIHMTCGGALGGGVLKDGEDPLTVSNKDWQKRLTDEQYYITRERGTERPFSGEYVHNKEKGTYHCVCCGALLFSSNTKYDSGSGWPSFYEAVLNDEGNPNVLRKPDISHGMKRVEVTCRQCDAHLGHVFEDGPQPTNERFCINSASLKFEPSK